MRAIATRVASKGQKRAAATATAIETMQTIATVMRLAGNKEGQGACGKNKCDGNEGGGCQRG